ncbi:hypothetical protein V7x_00600 [Crateriforma conspicua]|uniref:Uncharacterized protein n=1 Tax=Crateriforma conspicua TaxID=2527996 RepID=A0A5C6FQK5_9PLAN|nr:hypothetical protein [Crateriforma conspicua]TWU64516.1 hypothetical protein V7x_00600 [Crateriforma conspicua]
MRIHNRNSYDDDGLVIERVTGFRFSFYEAMPLNGTFVMSPRVRGLGTPKPDEVGTSYVRLAWIPSVDLEEVFSLSQKDRFAPKPMALNGAVSELRTTWYCEPRPMRIGDLAAVYTRHVFELQTDEISNGLEWKSIEWTDPRIDPLLVDIP